MGIAPALADWPDTGHFHLIIDSEPPNPDRPISNKHLYLHKGQTEAIILKQGRHTMQIVIGAYSHLPHDTPVMSEQITINVE